MIVKFYKIKVNSYDIWSEGYRMNEERGTAYYHGKSTGIDFQDACDNFAKNNPEFASYYNSENLSYWGCRLFDNESSARALFG